PASMSLTSQRGGLTTLSPDLRLLKNTAARASQYVNVAGVNASRPSAVRRQAILPTRTNCGPVPLRFAAPSAAHAWAATPGTSSSVTSIRGIVGSPWYSASCPSLDTSTRPVVSGHTNVSIIPGGAVLSDGILFSVTGS